MAQTPGLCVPFGRGFLSGQLVSALKAIISWMGCVDHRKTKRLHIACKLRVLLSLGGLVCWSEAQKIWHETAMCNWKLSSFEGSGTNFMESSTGIVVDAIVDRQESFLSLGCCLIGQQESTLVLASQTLCPWNRNTSPPHQRIHIQPVLNFCWKLHRQYLLCGSFPSGADCCNDIFRSCDVLKAQCRNPCARKTKKKCLLRVHETLFHSQRRQTLKLCMFLGIESSLWKNLKFICHDREPW